MLNSNHKIKAVNYKTKSECVYIKGSDALPGPTCRENPNFTMWTDHAVGL